jgi:hypothetical protein
MNPENPAVLSDEDAYAAMIAETRAQATQEATPAPAAAEAPQTTQDERPRDEQGRFAPRQEGAPAASTTPPEPFEGFSELPPAVQEQFRGILGRADRAERERNSFRDRFSRANQLAEQLRRQQQPSASQGSGRQSPQPSQGSGHQAQPGIAQARADVATMAPGQQRDSANAKLDAWEKHLREYPDEAHAFQQYVDAQREAILASAAKPEQVAALEEKMAKLNAVVERFEQNEAWQEKQANQKLLDEIAPGWDILTGQRDEQGEWVPQDQWKGFHPAMNAWLDGHDPEVKAHKLQQMASKSPRVAGEVIREFLADWEAVNGSGQQTTAPNPVAQRRADAIRDVAPTGAGGSPTPAWRQGLSEEDQYAEFMANQRAQRR